MPTPVSAARQCLTPEAAQALDEAVAAARRRGHVQTTSLHALSTLLSLPSSAALRHACARAAPYPARIQLRVLELCLAAALDRLPSPPHQPAGDEQEPLVSNSLMAAIKRSQANQRRQPENFQSLPAKVELQTLIISVLDDPTVSRVLSEAGFRSYEIKLVILRPVHQFLRSSYYRRPPMFLCNFTDNSDQGRKGLSFPFLGFSGCSRNDQIFRRIGEVLVKSKERKRNPLLVGAYAVDALRSFLENLQTGKEEDILPVEVYGMYLINIKDNISKLVNENSGEGLVRLRFKEVAQMVEDCNRPGVVIHYGDLKVLIGDDSASRHVVCELTGLMNLHGGKVRLMGAAESYEIYLKFLNRFPSIEEDLDLQPLRITYFSSAKIESSSYPRSRLMESFVPFGGLFSAHSDLELPSDSLYQRLLQCDFCKEKSEEEVSTLLKPGFMASVVDQQQSSLPSWLQMAEVSRNQEFDFVKAKDDALALGARVNGLQRKWDNIYQQLHHAELPKASIYQADSKFPCVMGSRVGDTEKESEVHGNNNANASLTGHECREVSFCVSMDVQTISRSQTSIPLLGVSKAKDENFLFNSREKLSQSDLGLYDSSVSNGHTSSPSATSAITDLGLGIYSKSTRMEPKNQLAQTSTSPPPISDQFDQRDFKMLCRALYQRIRCQEEAISHTSQTIACYQIRKGKHNGERLRGDIWLNFLGPDIFSKRKIALALAKILFGSQENFMSVNLRSQEMNGYDVKFRGKTIIDYVAGELSKKPLSVVFLENIDQADLPTQNSLSRAARTGRFLDSHGREVSINNTVFLSTSKFTREGKIEQENSNFSEESLQKTEGLSIQMVICRATGATVFDNTKNGVPNPVIVNKRKSYYASKITDGGEKSERFGMSKRAHLDLNLPAEEIEESESIFDNSKAWMEEFSDLVDETVVFKPFDFDTQSEKILKQITDYFHRIVTPGCLLEIESKVIEQILAAMCLSESSQVEHWIQKVLSTGFVEAQKRHNLGTNCVLKLVTGESLSPEELAPGVCLPSRIIVD